LPLRPDEFDGSRAGYRRRQRLKHRNMRQQLFLKERNQNQHGDKTAVRNNRNDERERILPTSGRT
jgi:hypothetical protein